MEKDKHWRDIYKSDYLASWDLDKNYRLTISHCKEEMCKLAKGKELKVVAYFKEPEMPNGVKTKPMVLNPTNCKFLQTKTGIQFFNLWKDIEVEISVQENKGGIGNDKGLRIVNVFSAIDWNEIQELFNLKEESLNGDEKIRAEKIIKEKDANAHGKLLKYLQSK